MLFKHLLHIRVEIDYRCVIANTQGITIVEC